MNAEILCVGTELLLGQTLNTNATELSKGLASIGIGVYHHSVVGDNPERLKQSLDLALSRADLVVLTGGLGPTYDDLTKEMVAEYFSLAMEMHPQSLEQIETFFKKFGREMTENNKKQALMPKGAVVFQNEHGTAPGLCVEGKEKMAILLPGPPSEMLPMFENHVMPFLQSRSDRVFASENIHIFGMGESKVESLLKELMIHAQNPTVAPYAKQGEVMLRVTASAPDRAQALALTHPMVEQICTVLGDVVYGIDVDSLQNAVVQKLTRLHKTVATAESCTGGLISKRITEIPGSSSVFCCGICTYSNEMKQNVLHVSPKTLQTYTAVSEQTAKEMAKGIRAISGADIGISTTGYAGPDGGDSQNPVGTVYIGIDTDQENYAIRLSLSRGRTNERESIRYLASSHALSQVLRICQN